VGYFDEKQLKQADEAVTVLILLINKRKKKKDTVAQRVQTISQINTNLNEEGKKSEEMKEGRRKQEKRRRLVSLLVSSLS